MSTDVIEYLRDIEVQVEYRRREVANEIQSLEDNHKKKLNEMERSYQAELTAYSSKESEQMKTRLEEDVQQLKQTFIEKKEILNSRYEAEKDLIVQRIVKEVLSQYGYRQNEEVNNPSGAY